MNDLTLAGLVDQAGTACPAGQSLFVSFGDFTIKVCANDQALIESLREYFGFYATLSPIDYDLEISVIEAAPAQWDLPFVPRRPEPGKTRLKEEYLDLPDGRLIRKIRTRLMLFFGREIRMVYGPALRNLNQVINFINNCWMEKCLNRGNLIFHSAGVVWKNRGVALSGFSGSGKSTLALHLIRRGALYVSNDRLLVRPSGRLLTMTGLLKWPRINPGTILNNEDLKDIASPEKLKDWSHLSGEELWHLEEKYDAHILKLYGRERVLLKSVMDVLVIIHWSHESRETCLTEVDPSERRDLLPAYHKRPGLYVLDGQFPEKRSSFEAYQSVLKHCRVFELTGARDFDRACELIWDNV